MTDKSVMSVRQAAELDFAFARNGWTAADVKRLSDGDLLALVRDVVRGYADVRSKEIAIELDEMPVIPEGLRLLSHSTFYGGVLLWSEGENVELCLLPAQKSHLGLMPQFLKEKLSTKGLLLNANVLDYLLNRPHLIPKSWPASVYFWGTLYKNAAGNACVRYLLRGENGWESRVWSFDKKMFGDNFAAIAKSISR